MNQEEFPATDKITSPKRLYGQIDPYTEVSTDPERRRQISASIMSGVILSKALLVNDKLESSPELGSNPVSPNRISSPVDRSATDTDLLPYPVKEVAPGTYNSSLIGDALRYDKQLKDSPVGDILAKLQQRQTTSSSPSALSPYQLQSTVETVPAAESRVRDINELERAAHSFRTSRLRFLHETLREIHQMDGSAEMVKAFTTQKAEIKDPTQNSGEIHRQLTPYIAAIMSEPSSRKKFMKAIDTSTAQESDELKEEARGGTLDADIVIVGAGVQGSIFAARVRADNPTVNVLTIDANSQIGGQFRSYGERPVFHINSRNFRPQDNSVAGLPGSGGNLNSFGSKAPIQVTDFSTETYPTNNDLGDTAALNQFFSAPTMLGVEMYDTQDIDSGGKIITLQDTSTGERYTISTEYLVAIPGAGEREAGSVYGKILTAQELFSHFANPHNAFPMNKFKDKNIAIKGAGDTGKVVAELFSRLAPKEAYGSSTVQMGGPKSITWYGANFASREEYCGGVRSRYQQLSPFIAEISDRDDSVFRIYPTDERIQGVIEREDGVEIISSDFTPAEPAEYDFLIDCSTLDTAVPEILFELDTPVAQTQRISTIDIAGGVVPVAQSIGRNTYIAGPAAMSALSSLEQSTFAKGITENTVSIWANSPRTEALGQYIARQLPTQGTNDSD